MLVGVSRCSPVGGVQSSIQISKEAIRGTRSLLSGYVRTCSFAIVAPSSTCYFLIERYTEIHAVVILSISRIVIAGHRIAELRRTNPSLYGRVVLDTSEARPFPSRSSW